MYNKHAKFSVNFSNQKVVVAHTHIYIYNIALKIINRHCYIAANPVRAQVFG